MLEIVLVAFVLLWATMLFAKYLIVEIWAVTHGQESPRLARKDARKELERKWGQPTVAQAIETRLVRWIEKPRERHWLKQATAFVAEVAADSIAEARIRHYVNSRKRAARSAGFRFTTGGPSTASPPGPTATEDAPPAWTCHRCTSASVGGPTDVCGDCESEIASAAAAAPDHEPDMEETHDPVTDRPDPPDHDTTAHHDGKEPTMGQTKTHRIIVDVNDPCTALQYAQNSRGFVAATVDQLEVLANNLRNARVGPAPIAEVNVMADAGRTFVESLGDSVKEYAEHVVIQSELYGDPDLRETVQDTYLDGDGAAVTAAPPPATTDSTISAVDCHTPGAAKWFMDEVAAAFDFLRTGADHVKGAHEQQGIAGKPIDFLDRQLWLAAALASQAERSADTFAAHMSKRADTIGKKEEALGGTQNDRYLTNAGR